MELDNGEQVGDSHPTYQNRNMEDSMIVIIIGQVIVYSIKAAFNMNL